MPLPSAPPTPPTQAAASSQKARAAADQAGHSQNIATSAAWRAYRFAVTARVSAQQAAGSAARAATAAADAAGDAAAARDAAYRNYLAKLAAETRLNRANPDVVTRVAHGVIQLVEVFGARRVTLAGDRADLRRGKPDSGTSAGDDRDLVSS